MNKHLKFILVFLLGVVLGFCGAVILPPHFYAFRQIDNIDLPFTDDPAVLGSWEAVDFVNDIAGFYPDKKSFRGELYLKDIVFKPQGKTMKDWMTWTRGTVMHHGDKTAANYYIKNINGQDYMFFEWKSGDYIYRHHKPHFYVLKRK